MRLGPTLALALALAACSDAAPGVLADASSDVASETSTSPRDAAADAALTCLDHWTLATPEGSFTTATRTGSPILAVRSVDHAAATFTFQFAWHDQLVDQVTGLVVERGDHAGHVHMTVTPPLDVSLGQAHIALDLRFDGTCAALLGTGQLSVPAPETGVVVIAHTLPFAAQQALLRDARFEGGAALGDVTTDASDDGLIVHAAGATDRPIDMAWDGSGFSGYTSAFPIDGDAARATFDLTPDGRGAILEVELALYESLTTASLADDIAACLDGRAFDGWLPFAGGPSPAHVVGHLAADGALTLDVTAADGTTTTTPPARFRDDDLVASGYPSFARCGDLALAVAADCSAVWGMTRDGRWRDAFLFPSAAD